MVGLSITAKSSYFKELLFPFFKIFYTLIVQPKQPKQPYREVINFVSYIHVVNFIYLYMRTHYVRHLANIIDIRWSRPVWGGGGGQLPIEMVNLL